MFRVRVLSNFIVKYASTYMKTNQHIETYKVVGLSRLTLCKVVSRGRVHGDSAYKLVRTFSWKSSHLGKHMGIPK